MQVINVTITLDVDLVHKATDAEALEVGYLAINRARDLIEGGAS